MEIKKLEWDSQFFGFPVGDIFIEEHFSDSLVLNSDTYKFFQVRSVFPTNIVSDTHLLTYWETKTIFSKKLTEKHYLNDIIFDYDEFPLSENSLYDLAYESGKHSRYKQDENITEEKFRELYKLWIVNSINKSFAAVSYTHLYNIGGWNEWQNIDLIKELIKQMDAKLGKPAGYSEKLITFVKDRPGHDKRYAIDAVSYTHLDVYKRQILKFYYTKERK